MDRYQTARHVSPQERRNGVTACPALTDDRVIERECGALERIADHWPGTVLTWQPTPSTGRSGIRVRGLADFLEEGWP